MSLGGLIGGVAGGVFGFFVSGGNPMGALYGASVGFGIGMMIDPITPDMQTPGTPNPEEQVMESSIGGPIPDLCGTGKPMGHLLFFGKERNEKVYSETTGGGKGGSDPEPQVTGYKYYMSWGVGICAGEVDTLYAIYKNDDVHPVWEGELNCPESGGEETIILREYSEEEEAPCTPADAYIEYTDPCAGKIGMDLGDCQSEFQWWYDGDDPCIGKTGQDLVDCQEQYWWWYENKTPWDGKYGMDEADLREQYSWVIEHEAVTCAVDDSAIIGSAVFYFGTDDQMPNSKVGEIISDDTLNTPYRHMSWCFFDDCYIGQVNRTPTYTFIVKKIPSNAFSVHDAIQTYDANPAHAIKMR